MRDNTYNHGETARESVLRRGDDDDPDVRGFTALLYDTIYCICGYTVPSSPVEWAEKMFDLHLKYPYHRVAANRPDPKDTKTQFRVLDDVIEQYFDVNETFSPFESTYRARELAHLIFEENFRPQRLVSTYEELKALTETSVIMDGLRHVYTAVDPMTGPNSMSKWLGFDGEKHSWEDIDLPAIVLFDAHHHTELPPIRKTSAEWDKELDTRIMDPDGWRMKGAPDWNTPITEHEFITRCAGSTRYLGNRGKAV